MRRLSGIAIEILDMLRLTGEISPSLFKYGAHSRMSYLRQAKHMSERGDWCFKKDGKMFAWRGIKLLSFNGGGKTETKRYIKLTNEAIESGIFDAIEKPLDFQKLSDTGNPGNIRRNCVTAWLGYIFSSLGYRVHTNEKKSLSQNPEEKIQDPRDYYTLKETKTSSQDVLTAKGRSYGALIDQDRAFVIYYLQSAKSKVYHETEVRSQIAISYTLKENIWLSVYYHREPEYFKNALIIAPESVLYDLYADSSLRSDRLSISDDTYRNYYFSTPEQLKTLLPYMANVTTISEMNRTVFGTEQPPIPSVTFCDAVVQNGDTTLYILAMCDMNLSKLKRFCLNVERGVHQAQYILVCSQASQELVMPLIQRYHPVCSNRGQYIYILLSFNERIANA